MNHIIGDQLQRYNEFINICPIQIYEGSKSFSVQKTIQDSLQRIRKGVYGAMPRNKLVIQIEDLSLCQQNRVQVVADNRNAQINKDFSPQNLEIFRQIMTYHQFYDYQFSSQYELPVLDSVEEIKLEGNISLVATMTFNSDSQFYNQNDLLPARNRSQWILMGLSSDVKNLKDIFYSIIIRGVEGYWQPSTIQSMAGSCLKFIIELQEVYNKFMQNTVNRFLLLFNTSVYYRLIHSLILLDLKMMPTFSNFDMGKFLVAESYRTLLDRFKDKADRKFLNGHIQDLAKKYFPPDAQKNEKFPIKMNRPLYSHLVGQQIIDLQFREVDKLKSLSTTINELMTEYHGKFKNKLTTEKSSINLKKSDDGESIDNYRPINIQLFEYVLEQVVKINRALLQPFSSTILIGIHGLGKVPLTRLSIITTKYLLFEPTPSQNFNFESFNDLIRQVIQKIAAKNKGCVLNLQEEELPVNNHGQMMSQLSCVIRTGNIPNLFSQREEKILLGQIESTSPPVIRRPNPSLLKKKGDIRGPPNQSMEMIINQHQLWMRIRRQFKLLLSIQPNGPLLKSQFRKHTAFISQNTLIWLQNWPEESFKDVGSIFIQQIYELPLLWEQQQEKEETSVFTSINLEIQQDKEIVTQESKLLQTAIRMHIEAQDNLVDVQRETGQYVSISPQSYLNHLKVFQSLLKIRMPILLSLKQKTVECLDQLDQTQKKVIDFQVQIQMITPKLENQQQQQKLVLKELDYNNKEMGQKVAYLENQEKELQQERDEAKRVKDECQQKFDEVMPVLKKAIQKLQGLSKNELTELKTIKKPSESLYILMQSLCIILDLPPKRVKGKGDNAKFEDDYWSVATGNRVLNNFQIFDILSTYDPERMTTEIFQKLHRAQSSPEYTAENIKRSCKAAQGIYRWIQALQNFSMVYAECGPKRDALFLAEKAIKMKEQMILEKRTTLHENQAILRELHEKFVSKEKEIIETKHQLELYENKNGRAHRLLQQLKKEKERWSVLNNQLKKRIAALDGDCLLGSGILIYFGQLDAAKRAKYTNKWLMWLEKKNSLVKVSEDYNFIRMFGDHLQVQKMIQLGLPSDTHSISSAIMLTICPLQTIIVDPEGQAKSWIKADYQSKIVSKNTEELSIITLSQMHTRFRPILKVCIKYGKTILIENIGENLDTALLSLINSEIMDSASFEPTQVFIDGQDVEIGRGFKFYLFSELPKPNFPPDQVLLCNILNFLLTQEALESQLLSVYANNKLQKVQQDLILAKEQAIFCMDNLKQMEEKVITTLRYDIETILNDNILIDQLKATQESSKKLHTALHLIKERQKYLNECRAKCLPAASCGAMLFTIVKQLPLLDGSYVFSLQHFMTMFQKDLTDRDDHQSGNKKFIKDFQQKLIKRFYTNICMGLLQSDKILLSFLLCMQIMKNENLRYNEEQINFILKGGRKLMNDEHFQKLGIVTQVEKDEQLYMKMQEKQKSYQNPRKVQLMNQWSDWVTDKHWEDLMLLSRIAPFDYPSIIDHMTQNPKLWEEYIKSAEDHFTAEIPGDYLNYNIDETFAQGLSQKLNKGVDKIINHAETLRSSKLAKGGAGLYKVGMLNEEDFEAIFEIDESDSEENTNIIKIDPQKLRPDSQTIQYEIKKLLRESLEDPSCTNQSDEEDEFIAEKKINGVHQYTEVNVKSEAVNHYQQTDHSDEDDDKKKQKMADESKKRQIRLNQDLLRFCLIKIFRPELLMTQTKRFLENFLDVGFTNKLPVFNHHEVLRASTNSQVNLIIKDPNVNTHAELRHLQLLSRRQFPLHYISASYTSLQEFRQKIIEAAPNGHWVFLDDLHKVAGDIPEIMKFLHQIFNFTAEREQKMQIETTTKLIQKSKDELQKKVSKETGKSAQEFQESLLQSSQDSESVPDENLSYSLSYMEKLQYLNFLKELEIVVFQQSPSASIQKSGRSSPMREASMAVASKDDTGFTFLRPPDSNLDFYVSTGFRLWISIDYSFIQAAKCPPSLLASSNKIMIEHEQDLKGTTSQILSSTNNDLFVCCQEFATQYRLGYFAMSFLHSMLIGKTQYFSLGWKAPYSFSMNDHQIASQFNLQLLKNCNANEKLAVKSITTQQYYLGEIIYGARMESLEDRNSLQSLITQVINQQSLIRETNDASKIKPYNLTGIQEPQDEFLNNYKMPLSLTLDFMEANLQKYPVIDRPEVFGISSQLQLLFLQKKGETLLERIYAIQCADTRIKSQIALQNQGISSHEDDLAAAEVFQIDLKRQKTKLLDALYKIPDLLEFPANIKSQNITCFVLIIKKEVQLYNNLIKEITNRLKELIFCLETQSQMSIKMEAEFFQIQQDITPNSWVTISYPAFSCLPSFLINLQDRVSYISELLESPKLDEEHIFTFWLPGFYDPKCFLSLLRQHESQKQKIPLDKLFFQFDVFQFDDKQSTGSLSSPTQSPIAKPQTILKRHQTSNLKNSQEEIFQENILKRIKNSYLIYGLHLQCGLWDGTCIKDLVQPKVSQTKQDSAKLVSHFPPIILQTTQDSQLYIQNSEKSKTRPFKEDQYLFSYWNQEEIVDVDQNKYYMVPVYITQDRDRLPKTKLNYGGLVTRIPLRTDNQEQKYFWAKRGLALLCHVEE